MKYFYPLIISMFLLTGCAVTRDHISLNYDPMTNVEKVSEAEKIKVGVAVNDNRLEKDNVGRKINVLGMKMAKIVCNNPIHELVKEALLKELSNRGFTLGSGDSVVLVDVELTKMLNKFRVGFFAGRGFSEANLNVKIQNSEGTITYNNTVVGKGENRNIQIASGRNAKIALEKALQHAIAQIMADPQFISALRN